MDTDQALLSVLVVNFDFKLQTEKKPPAALLGGQSTVDGWRPIFAPIIRVFGCSDGGQRVCAHIHGVRRIVMFCPVN